jgi:hypothetical protein
MQRRAAVAALIAVAVPAGYAGVAGAQEGPARQTVRMDDFRFRMPSNLDAGRTRFVFRNTGEFAHNFTVVAALGGGRPFRSATIPAGRRQRKTVRLQPGAYVAICTVFNGGHLAQGMEKRFTVGTFNGETGEWEDS